MTTPQLKPLAPDGTYKVHAHFPIIPLRGDGAPNSILHEQNCFSCDGHCYRIWKGKAISVPRENADRELYEIDVAETPVLIDDAAFYLPQGMTVQRLEAGLYYASRSLTHLGGQTFVGDEYEWPPKGGDVLRIGVPLPHAHRWESTSIDPDFERAASAAKNIDDFLGHFHQPDQVAALYCYPRSEYDLDTLLTVAMIYVRTGDRYDSTDDPQPLLEKERTKDARRQWRYLERQLKVQCLPYIPVLVEPGVSTREAWNLGTLFDGGLVVIGTLCDGSPTCLLTKVVSGTTLLTGHKHPFTIYPEQARMTNYVVTKPSGEVLDLSLYALPEGTLIVTPKGVHSTV